MRFVCPLPQKTFAFDIQNNFPTFFCKIKTIERKKSGYYQKSVMTTKVFTFYEKNQNTASAQKNFISS